jgi:Fe2+ or Zn2+ uptake regulation protein
MALTEQQNRAITPPADPDVAFTAALRRRGQRVTPQRVVIHQALRELDRHVTAEELLAAVASRLPNVSLPTVYATLELLEELGEVRRVASRGGTVLYDPRTAPHHHVVCRICGSVADLDAPLDPQGALAVALEGGFVPEHAALTISGVCAACSGAAQRP